jgi:hypothetical protein
LTCAALSASFDRSRAILRCKFRETGTRLRQFATYYHVRASEGSLHGIAPLVGSRL